MKAFITYDGLPMNSGGAHHLGSKSPKVIFNSFCNFITRFTINKYLDIHIDLLEFSWKNIYKYSLKFGIPSFDLDYFIANRTKRIYWKSGSKELDFYVDEISKGNDLLLGIKWKFKFIDEKTEKILPGQSAIPIIDERVTNSQVYLRLSNELSTASVWFAFPFDNLSEENLTYINDIQQVLPFKYSKYSWKLWQVSANKKWYSRKLEYDANTSQIT